MSSAVNETLCTLCIHLKTCKYIEAFQKVLFTTDRMEIHSPISVDVRCEYHRKEKPTPRL